MSFWSALRSESESCEKSPKLSRSNRAAVLNNYVVIGKPFSRIFCSLKIRSESLFIEEKRRNPIAKSLRLRCLHRDAAIAWFLPLSVKNNLIGSKFLPVFLIGQSAPSLHLGKLNDGRRSVLWFRNTVIQAIIYAIHELFVRKDVSRLGTSRTKIPTINKFYRNCGKNCRNEA